MDHDLVRTSEAGFGFFRNDTFLKMVFAEYTRWIRRLIEDDALIPEGELCRRRHMSVSGLARAVADGRIFHVEASDGSRVYPVFLAEDCPSREFAEQVSAELRGFPGAMKLWFFVTPHSGLGGLSPLSALANGEGERVVNAAISACEQSAP